MQRVFLNSEENKLSCIEGFIEEKKEKGMRPSAILHMIYLSEAPPPSQSERIASTHLVPAGKRGQHYYTSKLSTGFIFWT